MGLLSVVGALAAFSASVHSYALKPSSSSQQERPGLDLQLRAIGNTEVEAVVTNPGDEDISVLNLNTFLDDAPVQKVAVHRADSPVRFEGIFPRYLMRDLPEDVFTYLPAGGNVKTTFDIAEVYDVSEGGEYVVSSQGTIPVAAANGTEITSSLPYKSNKLTLDVDGTLASGISRAIHLLDSRTDVQDDCQGSEGEALLSALELSGSLSATAADAALNNEAKFQEYFGTTDNEARQTVAERFQAVAAESNSTSEGGTRYYCNDPYGLCMRGTLAYTLPAFNVLSNCPLFYSVVPLLSDECGGQDQATTCLHEFTHAPQVVNPPTEDLAYGYPPSTSLSPNEAFNNADNYALFALDIHLGC